MSGAGDAYQQTKEKSAADKAEILNVLRSSPDAWNQWREANAAIYKKPPRKLDPNPQAPSIQITSGSAIAINISKEKTLDIGDANFEGINLVGANLSNLEVPFSNFTSAALSQTDFRGSDLSWTDFRFADLTDANLSGAMLNGARFDGSVLKNANFKGAFMLNCSFSSIDLSDVRGLENVVHHGPSSVGIDTLYMSRGKIPEAFLRGVGLPDVFLTFAQSLVTQPIERYSCFISYSSKDEIFARRLHNDLQANNVRCWFAPENLLAGQKQHEQIGEAIRVFDKLLVILSSNSMESEWVKTEISFARKREIFQNQRVLFPVRLVDFDTLKSWQCFDADTGKDSAREIREYYIPDFSDWATNGEKYAESISKLIEALKSDSP